MIVPMSKLPRKASCSGKARMNRARNRQTTARERFGKQRLSSFEGVRGAKRNSTTRCGTARVEEVEGSVDAGKEDRGITFTLENP
jgi:hypothetical protein